MSERRSTKGGRGRIGGWVFVLASALVTTSSFGAGKARPAKRHSPRTAVTAVPAPAASSSPHGRATEDKVAPTNPPANPVTEVKTEADKEGVKTYKFGAVEVEGRLRSPQLIYFLRRVRAEFDASDLGHRSFLRELSETERKPAFR